MDHRRDGVVVKVTPRGHGGDDELAGEALALSLDAAVRLSPHDAAWTERSHRTADALG